MSIVCLHENVKPYFLGKKKLWRLSATILNDVVRPIIKCYTDFTDFRLYRVQTSPLWNRSYLAEKSRKKMNLWKLTFLSADFHSSNHGNLYYHQLLPWSCVESKCTSFLIFYITYIMQKQWVSVNQHNKCRTSTINFFRFLVTGKEKAG